MGSDGSKPDIKQLSKSCVYTTKELFEWYKKHKRQLPIGNINPVQFVQLCMKVFGEGGGGFTELCQQIFKKYDTDKNGTINFKEVLNTINVSSKGTSVEKLRYAFNIYDADGNGYLSEKEMTDALAVIYKARDHPNPRLRAEELTKEILRRADDDKDGRLSEEEFIKYSSDIKAIKDLLEAAA